MKRFFWRFLSSLVGFMVFVLMALQNNPFRPHEVTKGKSPGSERFPGLWKALDASTVHAQDPCGCVGCGGGSCSCSCSNGCSCWCGCSCGCGCFGSCFCC